MTDKIDLEIDAIKTIFKTLQELDDDVRSNVIEYVLKRLGYATSQNSNNKDNPDVRNNSNSENNSGSLDGIQHIKQFKEAKQPKSAQEMTVLIAFYLQYIAEESKRKDKVSVGDVETWFRIADYPLPGGEMRFTLKNAKNAGYLDSVGNGEYKLNAVGYNLIKHNLPRQESNGQIKRTKAITKKSKKK